jgi:hypothetical protein
MSLFYVAAKVVQNLWKKEIIGDKNLEGKTGNDEACLSRGLRTAFSNSLKLLNKERATAHLQKLICESNRGRP